MRHLIFRGGHHAFRPRTGIYVHLTEIMAVSTVDGPSEWGHRSRVWRALAHESWDFIRQTDVACIFNRCVPSEYQHGADAVKIGS